MNDFENPNAGLFGDDKDVSDDEQIYNQLYKKNPNRVSALNDLWFDDLMETVKAMDVPDEAKYQMIFKMATNSILDMLNDALPVEDALDTTFHFDMYMGVALTNKKYQVDLFKEQQKALLDIDSKKFNSTEEYEEAVVAFEEQWWSISQPKLEKRNPNEAIRETLGKYGLTDR